VVPSAEMLTLELWKAPMLPNAGRFVTLSQEFAADALRNTYTCVGEGEICFVSGVGGKMRRGKEYQLSE